MSDSDSDFEFDFVGSSKKKRKESPVVRDEDSRAKKREKKTKTPVVNSYQELSAAEQDKVDLIMKEKEWVSIADGITRQVWNERYNGERRAVIEKLFYQDETEEAQEQCIRCLEQSLEVGGEDGNKGMVQGVIAALRIWRDRGEQLPGVESVASCMFNNRYKSATPTVYQLNGAVSAITVALRYKTRKKKPSDLVVKIENMLLEQFLGK